MAPFAVVWTGRKPGDGAGSHVRETGVSEILENVGPPLVCCQISTWGERPPVTPFPSGGLPVELWVVIKGSVKP